MQFENAKHYRKKIKKLYRSAFPANERAPLFMLYNKTKSSDYSFYAITDKGDFVGLIYTMETQKLVYVFFLAVEKEMRGKGYGTTILDNIKKMHPGKTVTLMIEDTSDKQADNYQERINRLSFYQNNGFIQLGININEAGVEYELLGTDTNITKYDFLQLMKEYLGSKILYKYLYRKMKID